MIDPGLKGKVVLVTGGNNPEGIGAATARAFAAQGAAVMIHYYREEHEVGAPDSAQLRKPGIARYYAAQARSGEEIADEIRSQGGRAEAWEGDLGNAETIPRLLDQVEQTIGPVDVLVNNAAHCRPDTFIPGKSGKKGDRSIDGMGLAMETFSAESHDRHFAVNSRAVALLMAEFARRRLAAEKRWGRVINVSTDAASGHPDEVSYWASKHALESFSRAAARELGPHGIAVNVVSLGPIQTGWISAELEKSVIPNTPLRRVGTPEDVADVIVFLASEQARWLTGQLLYVGGGHAMPL